MPTTTISPTKQRHPIAWCVLIGTVVIVLLAIGGVHDAHVKVDRLAGYEQESVAAWDAMSAQQQADACAPLASMSRDDYQRIIQYSFADNATITDAPLAAYAWAELLESSC